MSRIESQRLAKLLVGMVMVGVVFGALPITLFAHPNHRTVRYAGSAHQQDDVPATITALYEQLQAINATKTAIAQATPATSTPTATAVRTPTRTPFPTHTPTPTPSPTRTPTSTPTRLIAIASVLVPTLNMRSGPGTDFPVIARSQAGGLFPIVAQVNECTWLQVVQESGDQVWISGSAAFTQMNVACSQVPAFVATRSAALPSPTATSRAVAQAQPTPTPLQPRPTPSPSPAPTAPPRLQTDGPTSVRIDAPADGASVADTTAFAWTPDQPLSPGQVYELAFWQPNETWNAGHSLTGASDKATVEIRVSNLGSGTYVWGIILGSLEPNSGAYQRLRFLGGNRTIVVNSGSSSNTNSDDNNPDNSDNPHAGEK